MMPESAACEICKTNEGRIHTLYYGNTSRKRSGNLVTRTESTRGEYENVILCDDCIKRNIDKVTYLTPVICLGITIGGFGLAAGMLLIKDAQIASCLGIFYILPIVVGGFGFIVSGLEALRYLISGKYRTKQYLKNVNNETLAKKLRKNKLKNNKEYDTFFTRSEFETIKRLNGITL